MSGGSFESLWFSIEEPVYTLKYLAEEKEGGNLLQMIEYAEAEGYPDHVIEYLREKIAMIKKHITDLQSTIDGDFLHTLKAIEWEKSGDWGKQSVINAVNEAVKNE